MPQDMVNGLVNSYIATNCVFFAILLVLLWEPYHKRQLKHLRFVQKRKQFSQAQPYS